MKKQPQKKVLTAEELGARYKCYKCGIKFYDLGKTQPICPSCGEDQNNEETRRMLKRKRKRRSFSSGKTDPTITAPENKDALLELHEDEGEYSLDVDDIVLEVQ
jgi:uncharacterized protein (TIGR02300 family)